jgi:RHS repeat-associated protein
VVSQRVTDAEPPRVQGHAARATELRYLARWSLSFSDLAVAVRQCLEVREQTLGSGTHGDGVTGSDGDHHGSPVVVTDARGEVIREKAYHPYGSTRCERADAADPFAYVGNEQDQGSGLSYFDARPYREQAGSFLAPDPVAVFQLERVLDEPERLSAYGYCKGDAVNRADPSGELWPAVLAGVAAAVGVTLAAQYANAPTRANPQTKHKDTPEMVLEATATAITISNAVRGAAALAGAAIRRAVARAAQRGAAGGASTAVSPGPPNADPASAGAYHYYMRKNVSNVLTGGI